MKKYVIGLITILAFLGLIIGGTFMIGAEEKQKEAGIEVAGCISEATEDAYKIRLMGYDVNQLDAFLLVEKLDSQFEIGTHVMVTLKEEAHLVDDLGEAVSFNTVSAYGEFLKGKEELLYVGEVVAIDIYKNDGEFNGKIVSIEDVYKEDNEWIKALVGIEPLENEPECGFFEVDRKLIEGTVRIGGGVRVTYDIDSLEVLSVTIK